MVPNQGLNGGAPLDELQSVGIQPLGLAPMRDDQPKVLGVHTAVTQAHHRPSGLEATALQHDGGLLDSPWQRMAIERSTAECTRTDDEVAIGHNGGAHLGAELERVRALPLV